jgi:hypothetical protein
MARQQGHSASDRAACLFLEDEFAVEPIMSAVRPHLRILYPASFLHGLQHGENLIPFLML